MTRERSVSGAVEADTSVDQAGAEHPLGCSLYRFETQTSAKKGSKRAFELTGIAGAAMVPVGLAVMEGTVGLVMAGLGGAVALGAYWLSARKGQSANKVTLEVFEHGFVCTQGKAERKLHWNEVVDILSKQIPSRKDEITAKKFALAFETVGSEPLIIIVGGSEKEAKRVDELLGVLADTWLSVWCKRARVLLQYTDIVVGKATLGCEYVTIGRTKLTWQSLQGVTTKQGRALVTTKNEQHPVQDKLRVGPFPSGADRIAALAKQPPRRELLSPVRVSEYRRLLYDRARCPIDPTTRERAAKR